MTELPYEDRSDFEDADRGLIGALVPCVVKDETGVVVWDNDQVAFLDGDRPVTAVIYTHAARLIRPRLRNRHPVTILGRNHAGPTPRAA
jgi:alkyl sulfatase BDS1-like metallo-beta-lactamase superfamily hydrolase